MAFIDDLRDVKDKVHTDITQSQLILQESLIRCGLDDKSPQEQYDNIYQILDARNAVHDDIIRNGLKEDVSVTGAVTELICKIGGFGRMCG